MPRKELLKPSDVDSEGDYKLRISPQVVRQLVRLAEKRGLYWTEIATLLLTDGLSAANLWPVTEQKHNDTAT